MPAVRYPTSALTSFRDKSQIPGPFSKVIAMKRPVTFCVTAMLLAFGSAVAQTPYAGMESRQIKGLSDQQIADLRAGRGMGLALAAELNGYPGPSHVIELAEQLGLSAEQRGKIQEMVSAMKSETTAIGSRLIEEERDLERQFANRTIRPESLTTAH